MVLPTNMSTLKKKLLTKYKSLEDHINKYSYLMQIIIKSVLFKTRFIYSKFFIVKIIKLMQLSKKNNTLNSKYLKNFINFFECKY